MIITVLLVCGSTAAASQGNSTSTTKVATQKNTTSSTSSHYEGISNIHGVWIDPSKVNINSVNKTQIENEGFTDLFVLTNKNNPQGTLEPYIEKFKGSGINVHAWIICFQDDKGNWYDPGTNKTLVTNLTNSIVNIATNYNVNGIQLDYVRYPGNAYKYNGTTYVTSFVKDIYNRIQTINDKNISGKPRILLSATVMPECSVNGYYYGQDYSKLAPYLDFMVPMIYKGNYGEGASWIGSVTQYIVDAAGGTPVVAGLQTYQSDTDTTTISKSEIDQDIKEAQSSGSSGYALFRYGLIDFAPYITAIDPKNKAVDVAVNKVFSVTFDEKIKIGNNWIELLNSANKPVNFTESISGNVLKIKPTSKLVESKYRLLLHTGSITDLSGNSIKPRSFTFIIGNPPTIRSTDPKNKAVNIPVGKTIKITFSENIKKGTNWFELKNSAGKSVSFTSSINGKVLTIDPKGNLAESLYTLSIHTGSVTDIAGNPVALKSIKFSAGAPKVSKTSPKNGATKISLKSTITISFVNQIKSIAKSSGIYIKNLTTGKKVAVIKSISGKTLTLKMTYNRISKNVYQVYIPAKAVKDLYGNGIASVYTFKFKTV